MEPNGPLVCLWETAFRPMDHGPHDGVDPTNDRASEYDRRHNETTIKSS